MIDLQQVIAEVIADHSLQKSELQNAAQTLSTSYRQHQFDHSIRNFTHALGYLAVRFPATYTVTRHLFTVISDNDIQSIVDIGTGPGTAMWAALDRWPGIYQMTAFEGNRHMLKLAQSIQQKYAPAMTVTWKSQKVDASSVIDPADIIIMNYSLGEMTQIDMLAFLSALYHAANKYIVIVEPGTPHGFAMIDRARAILIEQGASIIAPCTHDNVCPMDKGDWCHFSVRVSRTALHRHIKDAILSYEDEKYSYLIVAKQSLSHHDAFRVVKKPLQRSGHVRLDLCDQDGLHKKTFSRKDFDVYQQARRVRWGDLWNDTIVNDDNK